VIFGLMETYPDRYAVVEHHLADVYEVPWGQYRSYTFYGLGGAVPTNMVDGAWDCPDDDYGYCLDQRLAAPTDVTIDLSATQVQGARWNIVARVCIEGGGTGKTMRMHTAALLDEYPNPPPYSHNTLMQDVITQDVSISAGSCADVTTLVQFDAVSWADPDDIKVVAWAQQPSATGPADVYQAAQMSWPFPQAPQLTTIVISPASATMQLNQQQVFTATGKDQFGANFPLTSPVWSLSGTAGGTFNPASGSATTTFTATNAGSGEVRCEQGGVVGSATLEVTGDPPVLTTIEISPATLTMQVNDSNVFVATGKDQYGADFTLTSPTWSTSGTGTGTFNPPSGSIMPSFTATHPGSCQIICEQDGVQGTASVVITGDPPLLTSIAISPASATLRVGEQQVFTATGTDQYGDEYVLDSPTWSLAGTGSGDGDLDPATGSPTTTFTATSAGARQIVCEQGGVQGVATVQINGTFLQGGPRRPGGRVRP
jgi:hypothetical protein